MTALCAAPRHGDDETQAEPSAALCRPCRLGLAGDLRRLPRLHAALEHVPATDAGDGTGLPFSEPAADCRFQMEHDLQWWCVRVKNLRGRDAPPVPDVPWVWKDDGWVMRLAPPLWLMTDWLEPQVTWCSFRDWAPDMAGAIAADRARAVALLDPWLTKQFEIPGADGRCLECGAGRMWVTVYVYSSDRRKSFIGCTACAARWEFGGAWLPFVRQVIRRRQLAATV